MGHFKVNQKDIFFILKEQLDYGSLCSFKHYSDLDEKTLDLLVNEAVKFAKGVIDPLNEVGDEQGLKFENGIVTCPAEFQKAFKRYGEDGWIAVARNPEYGGGGFPLMMRIVVNDLMYGACQAFNMAPSLTHGAAHLIDSFATEELKAQYVEKMYCGEWSGTMALTEPDAGSNLGGVGTVAHREENCFKIKGSKIFISWGEHDLTDNIVHLTLARIEGAPEGARGISLFIVPKYRLNDDGSSGEFNDVNCGGIEDKLGLHASPTCVLNFGSKDDCVGYLCGEENKGLAHMFQMMNQARINAAVSGMTIANTAYLNALQYTRERIQGRDVADRKEGDVPIIDHPDVRRMLLWMKAISDGMRSMIYTAAYWSDLVEELDDQTEKEHYRNLLEFVTPMIKAYCSDMGFRVCETAIQCLGGYGYCKEFPLEQYLRDVKIMSLYEGTNGIQSIDLMGRKLNLKNGDLLTSFEKELNQFCQKNLNHPKFNDKIHVLLSVSQRVCSVAAKMKERQKNDVLQWASYTYPALICLSEVFISWRLLDMAIIADKQLNQSKGVQHDFYLGKIHQANYFIEVTLPQTLANIETCIRYGREIIEIPTKSF